MARSKNDGWLDRLGEISVLSLIINPATMMVVVSFVAIGLWNRYHEKIDVPSDRLLTADMISISEQPNWFTTDIKANAIRESRLNEVNLEQGDAIEIVAGALAVQPWIKSIDHVRKTPGGINVQLQYRKPIAIVEAPQQSIIPIDAEAVVLIEDRRMSREEADRYWRISVENPVQSVTNGKQVADLRITGAAAIADCWGDQWKDLQLYRIVNYTRQPTNDPVRLSDYQLWTMRKPCTKIIWGSPPGSEKAGEASATEKIQAIVEFVRENGPLDQSQFNLDVRSGIVRPASTEIAKQDSEFVWRN